MSEGDAAEVESIQSAQSSETEGQAGDAVAPEAAEAAETAEAAEEEEEVNDAASTASTSQSGRTEGQVVSKKRKLKFVFEETAKGLQRIKALKITGEGQLEHLIERSPPGVSADERSNLTYGDVTCLFQVLQQFHDKARSAPATVALEEKSANPATPTLPRAQPAEMLQTTKDILDINRPPLVLVASP